MDWSDATRTPIAEIEAIRGRIREVRTDHLVSASFAAWERAKEAMVASYVGRRLVGELFHLRTFAGRLRCELWRGAVPEIGASVGDAPSVMLGWRELFIEVSESGAWTYRIDGADAGGVSDE